MTPDKSKTVKKQRGVKVETWTVKGARRRFFILRDDKGRIVEKRAVAGSKLTKSEVKEIYKENKTFFEERKKVKFADSKKEIEIRTDKRDDTVPKRFQQLGIRVRWYSNAGRVLGESVGYSKLLSKQSKKEAENQAFIFAKAAAVGEGIIDYDNNNFEIIEVFYQSYITKFMTQKKEAAA